MMLAAPAAGRGAQSGAVVGGRGGRSVLQRPAPPRCDRGRCRGRHGRAGRSNDRSGRQPWVPLRAGAAGSRAAGRAPMPNASLTSLVLRYHRMNAGMIAIPSATPVPGNWKKARTASNSAEARDDLGEEASPRLERPQSPGGQEPHDPGGDSEPTPQPDVLKGRQVAEHAEPVEAEDPQPEEQEPESRECCEEAEDRDEDGWVLHERPSTRSGREAGDARFGRPVVTRQL